MVPTNCIKKLSSFFRNYGLAVFCMVLATLLLPALRHGFGQEPLNEAPDSSRLKQGKAYIYKLNTGNETGRGYKLVYMVAAPLSIYWKFKTDFENDFLTTNKLILEHRLVSQTGNVAVTEDIYATKPGVVFRWRTTSSPQNHRLDFELLNPQKSGQKFHYGHIQLEAFGEYTKVTQIAYFDFFGVTLWVNYPWYGGMQYFLNYSANWEQQMIVRLMGRYR